MQSRRLLISYLWHPFWLLANYTATVSLCLLISYQYTYKCISVSTFFYTSSRRIRRKVWNASFRSLVAVSLYSSRHRFVIYFTCVLSLARINARRNCSLFRRKFWNRTSLAATLALESDLFSRNDSSLLMESHGSPNLPLGLTHRDPSSRHSNLTAYNTQMKLSATWITSPDIIRALHFALGLSKVAL